MKERNEKQDIYELYPKKDAESPLEKIATELETAGVHVTEKQKRLVEEMTDSGTRFGNQSFDKWLKEAKLENLPRDLIVYVAKTEIRNNLLSEKYHATEDQLQYVQNIREKASLPESDFKQLVKMAVLKMLNDVRMPGSITVPIERFLGNRETLDPEIQSAIKHNLAFRFKTRNREDINIALDRFLPLLPDNVLTDPEMLQAAQDGIRRQLREGMAYEVKKLLSQKHFPKIPEEWIHKTAEEEMLGLLRRGQLNNALELRQEFSIEPRETPDFIKRPDVHAAAEAGLTETLRKIISEQFPGPMKDHAAVAVSILEIFNIIPEKFKKKPEIQELGNAALLSCLRNGSGSAPELRHLLMLSPPEKETHSAAQEGILAALKERKSYGRETTNVWLAAKIKYEFALPEKYLDDERIKKELEENFLLLLKNGKLRGEESIKTLEQNFSLDPSFLASAEVRDAAVEGIAKETTELRISAVGELAKKFSIPSHTIEDLIKQAAVHLFAQGSVQNADRLIQDFPELFGEKELQLIARKAFEGALQMVDISAAWKIRERFSLEEDFIKTSARTEIFSLITDGRYADVAQIREAFSPPLTPGELIARFPQLAQFLNRMKWVSQEFYDKSQKSSDILLSIFPLLKLEDEFFAIVVENPFLIDAIAKNARFGPKLLLKFREFDGLSRENIRFLLLQKKEVLAANPLLDPEDREFRSAMQKKLKAWKNNAAIEESLRKSKIDVAEWLDFGEESDFVLELGDNRIAFSETIATPLLRIKETLEQYGANIKRGLREYQKELSSFTVPLENRQELDAAVAKLAAERRAAEQEGNRKKADGIARGIENLQKKTATLKSVRLWDKLMGDIDGFLHLREELHRTHEGLISKEKEFGEETTRKTPDPKRIVKLKHGIATGREELKRSFKILERRVEEFEGSLLPALTPCLGKERGESLIQEMRNGLEEGLSHYRTDRNTITNLFSERADKDKETLDGRPMRVSVWSRNPDIDLYQGNYSPCCISIERGYYADGKESTIADYNTDLGIQIVNIWDETKKEPVTAAWCWLGESEDGGTALVVDNIESNTLYSTNFAPQLTDELFAYLKEYAEVIGVEQIVLGTANNDLPSRGALAELPYSEKKYKKIGGYNRPNGYFLEAEEKPVKVIWHKP